MNLMLSRPATYCFALMSLGLALSVSAFCQSSAPVVSCDRLARMTLPHGAITEARTYAAGEYAPPPDGDGSPAEPTGQPGPLPVICRVLATLKPSSDSDIKVEVWLPMSGWNGNLVGATYPGRGVVLHNELIHGVQQGYVALMNAGDRLDAWAAATNRPEKLIDDGYRALHEMTVTAKSLSATFYGSAVKHSYFLGCSEGGREGFNAAHHYPEDYDGIIVGGSGNQFAKINAAQLYPAWLVAKNSARFIPEAKFAMIHDAVIKACDSLDGVIDGVIEDPRNCTFKPSQLLCKSAEADDCLTAPQVELLEMIYAGTKNPRTGEVIFPGPALGSELRIFETANDKRPFGGAVALYKSLVFADSNWDWKTLNYDSDVALAIKKVGPYLHTTPADLKAFIDRGGKLVIWDGWNDYNSPYYWMDYYAEMQKLFGAAKVSNSVRMYFSPGMNHCFGGAGCDLFDKLGTIARFVETGKAPEQIIASHVEKGKVVHTRPMCAYPRVDKYKGSGDTSDSANFACTEPQFIKK